MNTPVATLDLGYKQVHAFVAEQKQLGNDVWFDGWTVCFFRPEPKGIYSPAGAYRNGVWGFENRTEVNDDGIWKIDFRNVKRRKKSRNGKPTRSLRT